MLYANMILQFKPSMIMNQHDLTILEVFATYIGGTLSVNPLTTAHIGVLMHTVE